jgi:hypothetical protein
MFEIQKLELLNKGTLIAKFNVKVLKWGGFVIRDCTLFDANGKKWVGMPARQYEVDGKKKYFSYVGFEEKEMDDKFKGHLLNSVEEYLSKMNVQPMKEEQGEFPF